MQDANDFPENDPRHHSVRVKNMLQHAARHAREESGKVDDPKARVLFETTAEILNGLVSSFEHFENKSEEAWPVP